MLVKEVISNFLTSQEIRMLDNFESIEATNYVHLYLSKDQIKVITTGREDEIILAIINRMKNTDTKRFGEFSNWFAIPECHKDYIQGQISWLKNSEFFYEGNQDQILRAAREDISPRYRAFFILKNPEKVYRDRDVRI